MPAASASPLLERERDLSAIVTAFDPVRAGAGRTVVVTGPAGIGKTRLLAAIVERARAAGFAVLGARAGELEDDLAWGVVRQLFSRVVRRAGGDDAQALFVGAAALALPVLGIAEFANGTGEGLSAALHGLYWLTANLADEQPLVVVVDDVQWADPASSRFVQYLGQRLPDIPVLVAVGVRIGEPGARDRAAALSATPDAIAVDLDPLSAESSGRIVATVTGSDPAPEFARACHAATGGNPYLLHELGLQIARSGLDPAAATAAAVSELRAESVTHAVASRLRRLDPDALALARVVAVFGGPAELDRAATLAGFGEDRAASLADALADASIFAPGTPLDFVHPLVRAAVYEGVSPVARERAHRRAARVAQESGDDPGAAAAQLLRTRPAGDPWVADALGRAAAWARARGAPGEALAWLRRALDEPPAPDARHAVLLGLGTLETELSLPAATERLRAAHSTAGTPRDRALTAIVLAQALLFFGDPPRALDVCQHAVTELDGRDRELDLLLEQMRITAGWNCPPGSPVVPRWTAAELPGRSHGERMVLLGLAADAVLGVAATAAEARALIGRGLPDAQATIALGPESFGLWGTVFLLHRTDALDASEAIERTAFDEARRRGSVLGLQMAALHRAARWLGRGALPQVAAAIAEALAIGGDRSPYFEAVLLYLNLELMIERGQLADADAEGERLAQLQVSWSPVATLFATCTRGRLRIAQGRYEEALADLMRIPAETRVDNPAALPWRSHASLALARLGRTDDALELMERELELARRFALPRSIGVVLRAAAALHRGDHAIDLLRESVDALGACPSDLERSHSLMELGSALRRSGRRRDAIAPLRDALELAERCDATALVERGRRELTDAGSRPHRPAHAGRDVLTPSELRIAQLASEGMANKEIAQSLFVSLRTIETHLTNAYRKLGISARAQLTTALADRASAG